MAKQQSAAAVVNPPAVRPVQKPVQTVAAVSKSQPTILPSPQLTRQVGKSKFVRTLSALNVYEF